MIICKIKTIKDFPLNKQTIIHSIKSVLIIKSFESAVKAVLCDHQVKQTTVLVYQQYPNLQQWWLLTYDRGKLIKYPFDKNIQIYYSRSRLMSSN